MKTTRSTVDAALASSNKINSEKKKEIYFLEAPCGSGKTHAVIEEIKSKNSYQKTLYISPTIALCNQVSFDLKKDQIPHEIIHSRKSSDGKVQKNIIDTINDMISAGFGTLLITHSAYLSLPDSVFELLKKEEFHVFIDEEIQIESFHSITLPRNYSLLTDYFEIGEQLKDDFHQVLLKDPQNALAMIKNQRGAFDQIDNIIFQMVKEMTQGYLCFVDLKKWNQVVVDRRIEEDKVDPLFPGRKKFSNSIGFHLIMNPEKFIGFSSQYRDGRLTMMSAGFSNLMIYKIFENHFGVKWARDESLEKNLRYSAHQNGNRLHIHQLHTKEPSKKFMFEIQENGERMIQKLIREMNQQFGSNKRSLFFTNNDVKVNYEKSLSDHIPAHSNVMVEVDVPNSWSRMNVKSHGMNNYSNFNSIGIFAAFNRTPEHVRFLTELHGFTINELNQITGHETFQQNISRTSLRNPELSDDVHVFLTGEATIRTISSIYPGANIHWHPDHSESVESTPVALTLKERSGRLRLKKLYQSQMELDNQNQQLMDGQSHVNLVTGEYKILGSKEKCTSQIEDDGSSISVRSTGASQRLPDPVDIEPRFYLYPSLSSSRATKSAAASFDRLTNFMKQHQANNITRDKAQNVLFSGTVFQDEDPDSFSPRKGVNARSVSPMLILDVDDGDMTPEDLEHFFLNEKIPSFIYSSDGHQDHRGKNKFRSVSLATKEMTIETFKIVMDYFLNRITAVTGFYHVPVGTSVESYRNQYPERKISGIDLSKCNATAIFYMPSTPFGREDQVFFRRILSSKRDLGKKTMIKPIDVDYILKNYAPEKIEYKEQQHEKQPIRSNLLNSSSSSHEDRKLSEIVETKFKQLQPGNRSYLSLTIVPIIKKIQDRDLRETLLHRLITEYGLDKSAVKSCKIYYT